MRQPASPVKNLRLHRPSKIAPGGQRTKLEHRLIERFATIQAANLHGAFAGVTDLFAMKKRDMRTASEAAKKLEDISCDSLSE